MASNNISGQEQIDEVVKSWAKLEKIVTANVEILERYSKSSSSLPSDYLRQVEETRKAQEALNKALEEAKSKQTKYTNLKKEEAKQLQKNERIQAKLSLSNSKLVKDYHKLNEAKKAADKLNREEAKRLVATQGLYNKVQSGINQVTKKYQDLAVRKELNGKLSAQETIELGKLEAKLNKYQNALKRVDANIGKHGRNVGNYKSGFDGLGFSVAQLTREMPAFANSMQTGFMAISNNIPMLTDEINKLKIANKELASSGKPTVSILKSLGKAMFSWHTLISVGVTLLTVYGAKIFDTIFAISEEEKALKKATEEMKEQNDALKENIALRKQQLKGTKDFVQNGLFEFRKILHNVIDDSEKTEAVLTELSDRLNSIGVADADLLKNQNILSKDRLIIAANLIAIEEQNIKLQEERVRIDNILIKKNEILSQFKKGEISEAVKSQKLMILQSASLSKTVDIQKEINRLNKANQEIVGKTIEIETDSEDNKREKIKAIKELSQETVSLVQDLEQQIEVLEKAKALYQDNSKEAIYLASQIKFLKDILALKPDANLGLEDLDKWSKNFKDQQKELFEIQKEYTKKRENLERQLGENIKEIGYSVADALFQTELNRLDKQARVNEEKANTALLFANGNAEAEAQIKEQLAEKQAEIEEKRIKTENKAFLFQQAFKAGEIAIDTIKSVAALKAQAAILLANPVTAPLASLALSQIPLVIATGATAGAAVLAQSIPAFWAGGETPGGQIMVNDDPLGIKVNNYKEVVKEPSGKLHFPQGKNVKMSVPKGSTVYPTYTDFNAELDNLLNINGVFPFNENIVKPNIPIVQISGGMTANDMDRVMGKHFSKHFSNLQTNLLNIDENGFTKKIIKGNSATVIHNNRTSFKGFSV